MCMRGSLRYAMSGAIATRARRSLLQKSPIKETIFSSYAHALVQRRAVVIYVCAEQLCKDVSYV